MAAAVGSEPGLIDASSAIHRSPPSRQILETAIASNAVYLPFQAKRSRGECNTNVNDSQRATEIAPDRFRHKKPPQIVPGWLNRVEYRGKTATLHGPR